MMYFFDMKCICSVPEVQVLERIILVIVKTFEEYPDFSPMTKSSLEHRIVRNRWIGESDQENGLHERK
jgi:hypothetical protein